MILAACLFLLVALGLAEQIATARARRVVPIRIHVNGTRGKSTVTRLIAAALREAGIPTVAKTTGTAARLILPDGSEQPIVRRGPANIREQAWFLRRAARLGARAVVVECMAIRPGLQWVSERRMVRSTMGVITNVRLDHTDVMGRSLAEIAESLRNTTPENGLLIQFASPAALEARTDSMAVRENRPWKMSNYSRPHLQNLRTALAVTRQLGIPDEVARRGMEKAQPDPGAARGGTFTAAGRDVAYLDLTAANDPESLDLLAPVRLKPCPTEEDGRAPNAPVGPGFSLAGAAHICVYNHRRDRPERLAVFAEHSRVFRQSVAIIITGDRPSLMLMRRVRGATASPRGLKPPGLQELGYLPFGELRAAMDALAAQHASVGTIIFCGNTRGFDVRALVGARE